MSWRRFQTKRFTPASPRCRSVRTVFPALSLMVIVTGDCGAVFR